MPGLVGLVIALGVVITFAISISEHAPTTWGVFGAAALLVSGWMTGIAVRAWLPRFATNTQVIAAAMVLWVIAAIVSIVILSWIDAVTNLPDNCLICPAGEPGRPTFWFTARWREVLVRQSIFIAASALPQLLGASLSAAMVHRRIGPKGV
ncbi:MAG: hypothetical protein LBM66_00275 [Bifidobacteriaceae bacterium]|nr:hypothetical protein [Bifidobacteriaceae bacterium]